MLAIGPAIGELEARFSQRMGGIETVAVQSGTAALHLALLASGVTADDHVIVPESAFVATVTAVCYCGATPLLADVDSQTGLIDLAGLARYLDDHCETDQGRTVVRDTGRVIRAIVPVHLYGHPVDMDRLTDLLASRHITVVEDAAKALGALYRDRPVGGLSHTAILSFNGNKVITGGAGGMILTPDAELAHAAATSPARPAMMRSTFSMARSVSTTACRTSTPRWCSRNFPGWTSSSPANVISPRVMPNAWRIFPAWP